MNTAAYRKNIRKLMFMILLVALAGAAYMLVGVNFENQKLFAYAMKIRTPKLIAMLITAFAIGGASIVFQSIINNTIVTPCLLGMNSLYTLIHTAVVFFAGSGSLLARNANAAFAADLLLMGVVATVVYSYLFKKTRHNVLYVLLIGTVLSSFFSSIQTTLTRVMDPNEYDSLLSTLVASFSNINSEIILFSVVVLAVVIFVLRKDLALLDVITLGKEQAVNLGVDYDRTIRRLLLGVTLCIAVATAMVGPISFLGLIIANLSRQLLKTFRHSQLILGSALFGMIVLVGGQSVIFCGQFIHAILFCSLLLRLLSFDFSLRIFLAQAGQYLDAPEPGTYSTPHTVQFLAGIAAHRFVGMICNSSTKLIIPGLRPTLVAVQPSQIALQLI